MTRAFTLALLTALVATAFAAASTRTTEPVSREIDAAIGTFSNFDLAMVPVRQAGLEILASSPEHELRVLENTLTLAPTEGLAAVPGALTATFEALIEGEGRLILEIGGLGQDNRIDDRVRVGRQRVRASAVVLLQPKPFGFQLDVIEPLQRTINVSVESAAAEQLVATCRNLGGFLIFNCDGLAASLRLARVPMPDPGSRFLLDTELLSEADRAFLEAYAAPAAVGPASTADEPTDSTNSTDDG